MADAKLNPYYLFNPGFKASILYPLSFVNHFAEGKRSGYQLTDLQPAYA